MNRIDEIIKEIKGISGKYSPYQIFSDWIEMLALSIANGCRLFHDNIWKEREEKYTSLQSKYSDEELRAVYKITGLLITELEWNPGDVLGEVFMRGGFGNAIGGQFFTPFHISVMIARTMQESLLEKANKRESIVLYEPSCGGGGMIIAVAVILQEHNVNYQKCLKVIAQDLDWRSVCMCYAQLSLLGVDAEVVQGDTLSQPYTRSKYRERQILETPRRTGMLL